MRRLYRAVIWTGREEMEIYLHAACWDAAQARVFLTVKPKALLDLVKVPAYHRPKRMKAAA